MFGRILAAAGAAGAAALGVVLARNRRTAVANADLWSQATRSLAERDLEPPSTVSVNSARQSSSPGAAVDGDRPGGPGPDGSGGRDRDVEGGGTGA